MPGQERGPSSDGHAGRFVRFGLVGASGVAVNAAALALLVEWLAWHYAAAAIVAIEISTLSNYLLNRRWTWKDRDGSWWSLINYYGVTLAGAVVQFLVLITAVERFGAHYLAASLLGVAAGTLLNFVGNDRLTFRVQGDAGRAAARRTARYMLAGVAMLAFAALFEHPWDGFVFRRTVEDWVLAGQTPYDTAQQMPRHAYTGSAFPIAAQWFAYPPVALLAMTAAAGPAVAYDAPLWALRMLVKVPAVVGVLVAAYLAHALVLPRAGQAAAVRTERWMLFGPITFVVAGIWGQFEPLLVAFLLAAAVAMQGNRWRLAGAAFALAVLTKPFALFLAPVWLVYAHRRAGPRAALHSVVAGSALAAAVCLPFLLSAPDGFWHQVAGMHAARAPANFSPISVVYFALRWALAQAAIGPGAAIALVGIVSMALTGAVLLATARASRRDPADLAHLMKWSTLAFGGAMLVAKVVNEQYLFIPFACALVWANTAPTPLARRLVPTLGIGVAAAGLVHGLHFILFVPQDVWAVLGADPVRLAGAVNLALMQVLPGVNAAKWVAGAMLAPAGLLLAVALRGPVLETGRWLGQAMQHRRASHAPAAALAMLALVLVPSLGGSAAAGEAQVVEQQDIPVVAIVRSDWWNPGGDPRIPAGRWLDVDVAPADGFYSATSAKAQWDAQTLHEAGVDAVVLIVDPALERQGRAWRMALERVGMPYVMAGAHGAAVPPQLPAWHTALHDRPAMPDTLAPWLSPGMPTRLDGVLAAGESALGPATFHGTQATALAAFLDDAQRRDARVVVVPWNDFGGLGGIEPAPSVEALDVLRRWNGARVVPPSDPLPPMLPTVQAQAAAPAPVEPDVRLPG